jgi:DNA-binding transcriptional ArsR family regulator
LVTHDLDELAWIFRSLSYRVRLEILNILISSGPQTVSEIAKSINIKLPAASQHLATLSRAGFITSKKTGSFVTYRVRKGSFSVRQLILLNIVIDSFSKEGASESVEDLFTKVISGSIMGPFNYPGRM